MSNSSGSAKQDKDARREAARAQAEQLRKSQAARERRSRNILLGVLGGVIVIVVAIGAFIFTQSQKTLLDDFDGAVPANTDNRGGLGVDRKQLTYLRSCPARPAHARSLRTGL